jgi:GNAT superfamily N-acetyltransferase
VAALTNRSAMQVRVRAASPGEGRQVAALWRELWDAHEAWGGYPGSRDQRVYAQLAERLDDDARVRDGQPILGRHVHLIADYGGVPCGQVEGWFERHGVDATTPYTCEVRSLVVSERARRLGAGRKLLECLAASVRLLARGERSVLAAEVLQPNPGYAFYLRIGYVPVSWNLRIEALAGAGIAPGACRARPALVQDALSLARLEGTLAARRRAAGDLRFDRPRAIDATFVSAIGSRLGSVIPSLRDPATLVAVDPVGAVRASASFTMHALEPPFMPVRRALLGRFALDPAFPARPLVGPLVALASRVACAEGATHVELTDLPGPGSELHDAALAAGAVPWSRVVQKLC